MRHGGRQQDHALCEEQRLEFVGFLGDVRSRVNELHGVLRLQRQLLRALTGKEISPSNEACGAAPLPNAPLLGPAVVRVLANL